MSQKAIHRFMRTVAARPGRPFSWKSGALTIAVFLNLGFALKAQPTLTAWTDRRDVALGETVSVRFLLRGSNDIDGFVPPAFSGFTVVHGPDTRLEFVADRGLKVPMATFVYLLRPERVGDLEIGSASFGSSGRMVNSAPLIIRVSQTAPQTIGSAVPSDSDRQTQEAVRKGIFIRLETDRTEAYVGEPLLVTYKLYTRLNSESQVLRRPSFAGFSVVEVERSDSSAPVDEVIDGQTFQSYVLRKVHLIPLREGRYDLEPVVVHNKVTLYDPDADPEESSLSRLLSRLYPDGTIKESGRKTEVTVQSPARSILVKPLPSGAPADFTGAVGRFRLTVSAESDTLKSGESGRLRMVIEGSGNLPLLAQPRIEWPSGVDSFEPESSEETDPTRAPLSGRRVFVIPFSSQAIGRHVVTTSPMSAFDPSTGSYYKLQAESVTVTVVPSSAARIDVEPSSPAGGGGNSSSNLAIWIGLLLIAGIGGFAAFRHFSRDSRGRHAVDSQSQIEELRLPSLQEPGVRLEAAAGLLSQGRPSECCRELERALIEAAESRHGVSAKGGVDVLMDGLLRSGVGTDVASEWVGLVKSCQVEAFHPVAGSEAAGRLLDRVRRLLGVHGRGGVFNR